MSIAPHILLISICVIDSISIQAHPLDPQNPIFQHFREDPNLILGKLAKRHKLPNNQDSELQLQLVLELRQKRQAAALPDKRDLLQRYGGLLELQGRVCPRCIDKIKEQLDRDELEEADLEPHESQLYQQVNRYWSKSNTPPPYEEGHQIYEEKEKNLNSPLLYTYPSSFKIATY